MLDGCLEWQRQRLAPPKVITEATKAYFVDQDIVQQWKEQCTRVPGTSDRTKDEYLVMLYVSWKEWAEQNGHAVRTSKWLAGELQRLGVQRLPKNMHGDRFHGIMITTDLNTGKEPTEF
jgi:putative DNA primase/helicase